MDNNDRVSPETVREYIKKLEQMQSSLHRFECSGKTCSECTEFCEFRPR
ncbi:MAG: hypothetical protein IJ576_02490 [Synergistaceae bacterium]|nr:hypothetical protein [Synergistaceae bacterium]MBR1604256.1 hypothetical protein [Synergistaceae bacterium]